MRNIVFINKEFISNEEALSLISKHGNKNVIFYVPQNNVCDEGSLNFSRVPHSRDYIEFRRDIMQLIESFCAEIHETGYADYKNADILKIIKYDLMSALEKHFYPLWALNRVINENPTADRIIYYPQDKINRNFVLLVAPFKKTKGIDIIVGKNPTSDFHSKVKLKAFELKKTFNHLSTYFSKKKKLKSFYHTIFVENYPNSANLLKPIVKEFNQANIPTLFIAMRKKVIESEPEMFSSNSIVLPEFTYYLSFSSSANFRDFFKRFIEFVKSHRFNSFVFEEIDFNGYLKATLIKALYDLCKTAIRMVDAFEYLFEKTRVENLLSTTYSGVYARAAVEIAKKHNCRTHYLQHGVLGKWEYLNDILQENIYVWGEKFKRDLLNVVENKQKRIEVVGLREISSELKSIDKKKSRDKNQENVISLFLSRMGGSVVTEAATKKMVGMVICAVRELNSENQIVTLKIKIHPGNSLSQIKKLISSSDSDVTVLKDYSTFDLILESKVCIVSSSTVGLEVCAFEKPLIYLDMESSTTLVDYKEYDAAYNVKNKEEIKEVLESIVLKHEHPKRRNQEDFSREVLNSGVTRPLFQFLK